MAIVFKTPKSALNTTTKTIQNLANDCPPCPEPVLEKAELEYTQNGEYTVTPEEGVDGFSEIDVTVNIPSDVNNQNKTVSPSTSSQSVSADSGYSGLGTVTVNAVTSSIDNNISAGNIKKDVTILGVTGNYDPQPNLTNITVTPSTSAQEYNPAISGVDGYSLVRVNAVTASIDSNIQAENILSGVTILGVAGSDAGYDAGYSAGETDGEAAGYSQGYSEGETAGYTAGYADGQATCPDVPVLNPLSVTPSTSAQTIYPESGVEDGFSDVSVAAVTAAIDNNITAGNIKEGVTILGVTGTYDPQPSSYAGEFDLYTIGTVTFDPDPNDGDYFSDVTVTVSENPLGSWGDPFDATYFEDMNELDYGYGYYRSTTIDTGGINAQTGQYEAEDDAGNSFTINPYLPNPDYDPEAAEPGDEYIFPQDFDLVGRTIVVYYDKNNLSFETDPENGDYVSVEISDCDLMEIDSNSNWDTWLMGSVNASTRSLGLLTNEPQQFSISSGEPWEIEIDQPNRNLRSLSKSGAKSPAPTLEIDQTEGEAGVFTLNVLSTTDQNTGFTVRGLNTGNEVYVEVNSVGDYFTIESLEDNNNVV